MTPATYFILAALQSEALHGYAIMQRAAELSQNRVRLATGTLYAALDRLTSANLITVNGEEIVNGRGRRYYALTDDGRAALKAEAEQLAAAARVVIAARPAVGLA
jgi:PadR family transcriptional regulator PadR